MRINDRLLHFEKLTIEEVTKQNERIIKDYQEALDKIFDEHKEEKIRQADIYVKTESEQLKRDNNSKLAQELLVLKRDFIKRQNHLIEELFVEVAQLIGDFTNTWEYDQLLTSQINEAKKFAKGKDIIIYIDDSDASKLDSLRVATNSTLEISESSFLGGTRAIIPSKNILIDNSFKTRLSELKSNFTFIGGTSYES